MEKIAEILNHYYDQIQNRVEFLLNETINTQDFRPSKNVEAFAYWSRRLTGSANEKSIQCFAGLASFFDGGVLLLRDGDRGVVQHLFRNGELVPLKDESTAHSLPLPKLEPFQIKKTDGLELYTELFQEKPLEEDYQALLIGTPTPFVYLTFSRLPHPWLLDQMEHLQACLKESLS